MPTASNLRAGARAECHSTCHRRAREARQHGRFFNPSVRRALAVLIARHAATGQQTMDAPLNRAEHLVHLLVGRRSAPMKPQSSAVALGKHAVQHQGMHVNVEIERRPEAADDRHGPAVPIRDAPARTRTAPQEAEHGADEDAHHRPAQRVIPGEDIPNPVRQGQHPLAHGNGWEPVVHQMRSALGHPPPATTGTDRPSLAGKGNQTIQATPVTAKACETARAESTAQKALELLLNEPG